MANKIFKTVFIAIIFIFLSSSFLLIGSTKVDPLSNPLSLPGKEPAPKTSNEVAIVPSQENEESEGAKGEIDFDDLFGDEQLFPWEPGLGNHAGAVRGINSMPGAS